MATNSPRATVSETLANHLRQRIRCVAGHHLALRHAAQPGDLALGQLARGGDAALARAGAAMGQLPSSDSQAWR
jgi:hypothetical protein